jgi:succinate dehydrogenase/fumarate reductase flavoprotein subunit
MQVIPRFVSTDQSGNDPQEFLLGSPFSAAVLYSMVFLKGYQWPFDAEKILPHSKDSDRNQDTVNGKLHSSEIDLLVYQETVIKNRRVFLDYRANPKNLDFAGLATEAKNYLEKSGALFGTPIERLEKMNPSAIQLYAEHGIDLRNEMLEIAVCAQHNNGGLAGTIWYESTNIKNLFPVGEVNGSHGTTRPGGSALNAGQVGAFRAAEYIANKRANKNKTYSPQTPNTAKPITDCKIVACSASSLASIRSSMSRYGGVIRNAAELSAAADAAWNLYRTEQSQYALTHAVYLDAIRYSAEAGQGCRGALVLKDRKTIGNKKRGENQNENVVLISRYDPATQKAEHRFEPCRPIPNGEIWFETAWSAYRNGEIY